jgi:hypothetical protein
VGVLVTASGRIIADRPIDQARLFASICPPDVLAAINRFVLDGGRGSVVLTAKDRGIIGARIDQILR